MSAPNDDCQAVPHPLLGELLDSALSPAQFLFDYLEREAMSDSEVLALLWVAHDVVARREAGALPMEAIREAIEATPVAESRAGSRAWPRAC